MTGITAADAARRWIVLAGGSSAAAEAHARALGVDPVEVIDRHELLSRPLAVRRAVRAGSADGVLVSCPDRRLQIAPQLLTLAAATAPGVPTLVADMRSASVERLSRPRLLAQTASIPGEVAAGALRCLNEARQLRRRQGAPFLAPRPSAAGAVLAVWIGSPEADVGGAVTHISGILDGFRQTGLKVGLLTAGAPPEQLASVIDELELIAPLRPSERLTPLHESICLNPAVRRAGMALARRLPPSFVYQRHRAYLLAGHDIARALGCPLVLEFNASETWHRSQWLRQVPGEQWLEPALRATEVRAVDESTVVAAVSEQAAEMARDLGAGADRVAVIANGVDADRVIELSGRTLADPVPGTIGWIGSFGPWHGAEVLIRALAQLPATVSGVMVGDGAERSSCEALADALGVGPRIEFTGALPHDHAVARLAGCQVLASPHVPLEGTRFFGSPTKLFEYMAIGRPIVASALEQIGEILEDGRTAVLVEPGDVDALAAGLDRVLSLPDGGASLGDAARSEALRSHTWTMRARAILDRLGLN